MTALWADQRIDFIYYPGMNSSFPDQLAVMNDTLFFSAYDDNASTELWKSDGTDTGTEQVKDIYPGTGYGSPYYLTVMNDMLYFRAADGSTGYELWKSDSTDAGTTLIKDVWSGLDNGIPNEPV